MAKAWWRDSDYALFDQLTKERDEARAEVGRLRDENAHRREMFRRETEANERLRKENDAMAAELHALSVRYDARDNESAEAYRRGAEAMREACASAMRPIMRSMISRTEAAQTIRALPIPGEP